MLDTIDVATLKKVKKTIAKPGPKPKATIAKAIPDAPPTFLNEVILPGEGAVIPYSRIPHVRVQSRLMIVLPFAERFGHFSRLGLR